MDSLILLNFNRWSWLFSLASRSKQAWHRNFLKRCSVPLLRDFFSSFLTLTVCGHKWQQKNRCPCSSLKSPRMSCISAFKHPLHQPLPPPFFPLSFFQNPFNGQIGYLLHGCNIFLPDFKVFKVEIQESNSNFSKVTVWLVILL